MKFKIVTIKQNFIIRVCSSGMWCQVVWWNGTSDTKKSDASTFRVQHRGMRITFIRIFKMLVPIYQTPQHHKSEECDVHLPIILQPLLHFYVHSNGIAKIMFAKLYVYPLMGTLCIFTWGQDSPEWLTWYYKINQWLTSIIPATATHIKQTVLQCILTWRISHMSWSDKLQF